jgi:hypothetical protein
MPQTAGKPAKKSSTSKRHFTVVIGTKEHGLYCSSSPSSAARKAVSKLCGKNVKNVEFCLREITQGSKKKTYGPYLGHNEKLAKPIELKGRVIERKPVALLKPKSSAKKGGMQAINISLGNCGRSRRIGFWKNGCITLINGQNKVVFYYNEDTEELEVRYFRNSNNNVYTEKFTYKKSDQFNIFEFNRIIVKLINFQNVMFEIEELKKLLYDIVDFINQYSESEDLLHFNNIRLFFNNLNESIEKDRLKYISAKNNLRQHARIADGL